MNDNDINRWSDGREKDHHGKGFFHCYYHYLSFNHYKYYHYNLYHYIIDDDMKDIKLSKENLDTIDKVIIIVIIIITTIIIIIIIIVIVEGIVNVIK